MLSLLTPLILVVVLQVLFFEKIFALNFALYRCVAFGFCEPCLTPRLLATVANLVL